MIINLEGVAARLTAALYGNADMEELERAKIEYGFSLTLGIVIGLAAALLLAALLGTVSFTLLLIISALMVRFFSGGAHCSSYDRCLFFSLLVFVPVSVAVKYLVATANPAFLSVAYLCLLAAALVVLVLKSMKLAGLVLLLNAAAVGVCLAVRGGILYKIVLPVGAGSAIQTLMLTSAGEWLVIKTDTVLKAMGI